MKKRLARKLTLKKETLAQLEAGQLEQVNGGATDNASCWTDTCKTCECTSNLVC